MSEFVPIHGRDASPTIRGYFYQIRTTLLRWLELDAETTLYCECGEDIDLARQFIDPDTGREVQSRVLEQIRDRVTPVNFRSPEVLDVLANFRAAQLSNPTYHLRLRYTTNAPIARERGVHFPGRRPGLEACRRLSEGLANDQEAELAATVLQTLLRSSVNLDDTASSKRRREFFDFIRGATVSSVLKFLRQIEWSLRSPGTEDLVRTIETRLVNLGLVSPHNAKDAINKLTVFVIETLAKSGPKMLKKDQLLTELTDLKFSDRTAAMLNRLSAVEQMLAQHLPEMASRIESMARSFGRVEGPIQQTQEMVGEILGRLTRASIPIHLDIEPPAVDVPPAPPAYEIDRQTLMRSIQDAIDAAAWVHLHAGPGMGKTQLARALAEVSRDRSVWISLRDARSKLAPSRHIDAQLAAWITSYTVDASWWLAYQLGQIAPASLADAVIRSAGSGAVIVLDDLPDPVVNPALKGRLTRLAATCRARGAKLVTTSERTLIPEVRDAFPVGTVVEIGVPLLGMSDVNQMLQIAGAPAAIETSKIADLIVATTKGHPQLVSGVVRRLVSANWQLNWDELSGILTGSATQDVRETAVRQMISLVMNPQQREMLYRLSLVGRPFEIAVADIVAAVRPSLPHPRELLTGLVDTWVNRIGDREFDVSPLLGDAGHRYLSQKNQESIHVALATYLLHLHPVSLSDALQACIHLVGAKAWKRLSGLTINVLSQVQTYEQASQASLLAFLFPPGQWPKGIVHNLRLLIRAQQVKIARLARMEVADRLDDDFDSMLKIAPEQPVDYLATFFALTVSGPLLEGEPIVRALPRAILATRLVAARHIPDLPKRGPDIRDLVWAAIARVRDVADMRNVVRVMGALPNRELTKFYESDIALVTTQTMADRAWLVMAKRPEAEQDWNSVLQGLDELDTLGAARSREEMRAATMRARAIVLADYLSDTPGALRLLSENSSLKDADCRFLLQFTEAQILEDAGYTAGSLDAYDRALQNMSDGFVYFKFGAYESAAEAASRLGRSGNQLALVREGLRFALKHMVRDRSARRSGRIRSGFIIPRLDVLEACGEVCISLWDVGQRPRALVRLYRLVRDLVEMEDREDRRWIEVYRKLGHALGWYASVAVSGQPPGTLRDGSEYFAPMPGYFWRRNSALVDLPMPVSVPSLFWQIGKATSSVGLLRLSAAAFDHAIESSTNDRLLWLRSTVQIDRAVVMALRGMTEPATAAALEAIRGFGVYNEMTNRGQQLFSSVVDPASLWDAVAPDLKKASETVLLWLLVLPMIIGCFLRREQMPVDELLLSIRRHGDSLLDASYWVRVAEAARVALARGPREAVVKAINGLPPEDYALRCVLYIALAEAVSASPQDALPAHAIVMRQAIDSRKAAEILMPSLCSYLVRYWRRVAVSRGFLLASPRQFSERMGSISDVADLSTACQVLLWAEEAAGRSIPKESRDVLVSHAAPVRGST